MRSNTTLAPGVFHGAVLEPGTFHQAVDSSTPVDDANVLGVRPEPTDPGEVDETGGMPPPLTTRLQR